MTCKCKTEIEANLLEYYIAATPDAKNHKIEIKGYSLIFGKKPSLRGSFSVEGTADHPLKSGGLKTKKYKTNLMHTKCPFCGERYEPKEELQYRVIEITPTNENKPEAIHQIVRQDDAIVAHFYHKADADIACAALNAA